MKKIFLTQGQVALVDDGDFEWLSRWSWCAHKERRNWYAVRREGAKIVRMHRAVRPDLSKVDHADRDGLNNQRLNLRGVNQSQNAHNGKRRKNNRSGCSGVCWDAARQLWLAYLHVNNTQEYIGRFSDWTKAIVARIQTSLGRFGEFSPYYRNFCKL